MRAGSAVTDRIGVAMLRDDAHDPRAPQAAFSLAVLIVLIALLVSDTSLARSGTFVTGCAVLAGTTLATYLVPWQKIPAHYLLALPLLDIVAVGVTRVASVDATSLGGMVVFPALWLGIAFRRTGVVTGTLLTAVVAAAPAILTDSSTINNWLRVLVLPLLVLGVASSLSLTAGVWAQQRSALVDQGERLNELFARSRADSELLQTVIDTVGVGILVIDADGRYESMNTAQERLNRLIDPSGQADSVDHDGYVFALDRTTPVPKEDRAECRAVRGESFAGATYWVGPKQATRRALSISANQLRDERGRARGAVLAYHDVTDHLQALRIKNEFLASVTHELRTPLTSIIGYLELIEDHADDLAPDVRGFLRVIQRNAERLLALVSDLLTTAQTEAGVMRLNLTDTDLREVLERSVDTAQVRADSQGVQLHADLSAMPLLRADPGRLYQVIDNVLSNAIKYTPRGGQVAVDLWEDGDADTVVFTVSDTGIGISETDLGDVFTKFFRASDVERRAIPGVGLGLAISKDMIEAHGGTVELGSVVGRGTTVTISLPRRLPDSAEQLASAQSSPAPSPASSTSASR